MDMNFEKGITDSLLNLQRTLQEIVQKVYLMGVNDGYKLGLKGEKPNNEAIVKNSKALEEAERILREHSEDDS